MFESLRVKIAKTTIFLLYTFKLWWPELRGSGFIGIENYVITKKGEINITTACRKI